METFVAGNQLVGERETWHESTLLQPENRSETSAEENSLDSSEGDDSLPEVGVLAGDPVHRPVSLLLDTRECLDGVEEKFTFLGVADVGFDEQRVHFRVDVLHSDLEAVEAAGFCDLFEEF